MRNINPFLAIGVLIILLLIALVQNGIQKDRIDESISKYRDNLKLAKSIEKLKKSWQDRSYSKREIENIINSSMLKSKKISTNFSNIGVEVKIDNIDGKTSDFVVNRLLNSRLKIKKLKIERDSNSSLDFDFKVEY